MNGKNTFLCYAVHLFFSFNTSDKEIVGGI